MYHCGHTWTLFITASEIKVKDNKVLDVEEAENDICSALLIIHRRTTLHRFS